MRYLGLVLVFVIAGHVLWVGCLLAQRNMYTGESFGTCNMITLKTNMIRATPSPKMLLVGGSNVTYGISASILAERLGMRVLNFGTHGGLGPAYVLAKTRQLVGPGDTVVLALEYQHYQYDKPVDVLSDTMLACDPDFFWSADLRQKRLLVYSVGPWRLVNVLRFNPRRDAETMRRTYYRLLPTGDVHPEQFDLNPITAEMRQQIAEQRPLRIGLDESASGVQAIRDFVAWARSRGVQVLATWPNTLYFPAYERSQGFAAIERFYHQLGVPVLGVPSVAMFPADKFYNSNYHLNGEGIALRTERLISLLAGAIPPPGRLVDARQDASMAVGGQQR